MEEKNEISLVPVQLTGNQMDAVEKRQFANEPEAAASFRSFAERLLDVNSWGKYADISTFQLIDDRGVRAGRVAVENDFIRIDIPWPGTKSGQGYDWVLIEEITESRSNDEQILAMRVRPCAHPLSHKSETAHFLKPEATSTFIIRQKGKYIFAEEHGRMKCLIPNRAVYDKGRNFIVGIAAKMGVSYPQWKSLVKGLLKD